MVLGYEVGILVLQKPCHLSGMLDVFTEDDGLGVAHVVGLEVVADALCHELASFRNNDLAVKLFLTVKAMFNRFSFNVSHAFRREPSKLVDVQFCDHNFVWGQEAVFNTLFE